MPWQWITLPTSSQLLETLKCCQEGTYLTFVLPPVIELNIRDRKKKIKNNSNLQVFNKQLATRSPKLVVPKRKGPHGLYMHTCKLFFHSEIMSYSSRRWIVTQIQEGIEGLTSNSEDAVLLKISASCLWYLTSQIYLALFLGKKDKIQDNKHRSQPPFLGTAGFLKLSLILFKISPAGLVGTNTSGPWASALSHKNQ